MNMYGLPAAGGTEQVRQYFKQTSSVDDYFIGHVASLEIEIVNIFKLFLGTQFFGNIQASQGSDDDDSDQDEIKKCEQQAITSRQCHLYQIFHVEVSV